MADFEALRAEIRTRVDTIRDIVGSGFEIYPSDLIAATAGLPVTIPEVRTALAALEARIVRSFGQHPALAEYRAEAAAVNQLLSRLETQDGEVSTALYEARYTRDVLGRITDKTETLGGVTTTHAYTYDPAGRLAEVNSNGAITAYRYGANGNRLRKTARVGAAVIEETTANYDTQDRLLQYGDTRYSYTPNGELRTKTLGTETTARLSVLFPLSLRARLEASSESRPTGSPNLSSLRAAGLMPA